MEEDSDGLDMDGSILSWDTFHRDNIPKRKNSGSAKEMEDSEDMVLAVQTVSKKKKKKKKVSQISSGEGNLSNEETNRDMYKVMVTFEKSSGKHMHPIGLSKAINKEVGVVSMAQCLGQGRVLIIVKDVAQRNRLLKLKDLNGEKISAREIGINSNVKGVIVGIPLDITMEEIKENVRGGKVINARRLFQNKEGQRQESLSILLTFEGKIPEKVQLGYLSYTVREFIPKPLRCFKCQRIGHVAAVCRGKVRCSRCGDEHEYDKCPENAVIKCCNCGGPHSAAYGGCKVQMEAREVQKYKVGNKVSYAEALKACRHRVIKQKEMRARNSQEDSELINKQVLDHLNKNGEKEERSNGSHQCRLREDSLIMTNENFLAFIIKVINVTAMMSSRSAKMKVVLEAASEFLGISGITVQRIHGMFARSSSHEASQLSN
nr:uncharacterized protein LOC129432503 [Misgurnus anguillicaudatus]